jgi:C1A family cysteine protease
MDFNNLRNLDINNLRNLDINNLKNLDITNLKNVDLNKIKDIDLDKIKFIATNIKSKIDSNNQFSITTYTDFLDNIPNFNNMSFVQFNTLKMLYMDIINTSKPIIITLIDANGNTVTKSIPPSTTYPPFLIAVPVSSLPDTSVTTSAAVPVTTQISLLEPMTNVPNRVSSLYKTNNSDLQSKYNLSYVFNSYPILNQGQCGTCWAYSAVTSLSDAFLVTGLAKQNPLLSVTSVLNNLSSECSPGGGMPSDVLAIQKGLKNAFCSNNYNPNQSVSDIQNLINKNTPTCRSNNNNSEYFASYAINVTYPGESINKFANPTNFTPNYIVIKPYQYNNYCNFKLTDLQNMIKRHILNIGPVVCCIGITNTFINSGYYPINNIYVYFENYSYTPNDKTKTHNNSEGDDFVGLHAMSVIGWETITVPGYNNIPCWIIRNSWGTDWGNKGCIYLPMYPYNKHVQIECWDQSKSIPYTSSCMFYDVDSVKLDATNPYPDITCDMIGYNGEKCTISNTPILNLKNQDTDINKDTTTDTTYTTDTTDTAIADTTNIINNTDNTYTDTTDNINLGASASNPESSSSSSSPGMIGGIAGGIIVLIIILYFLLRKNSKGK